ncbi:N-acetylglucosamine kinase-like BadF-type ATPase [Streptomyces sp. 1114.5]|uniref:N-acetylglucosamine kinase n=1 Tax=Streptomyces sp. 1114.5 TaxID=1938830 RepID=UPI000EAB64A7|nr:BadF/BadG/BcrA/BcrD ATPase family protein [Streptomyces sp. 1114.5]RKT19354.1 N-acetylglucosamine kinase-like BadF-type ATPase [Streptomyces sp. 1114.5]
MTTLHLGVDAGGTHTRAVLLDTTGAPLGRGTSGGANPAGRDPAKAIEHLAAAVSAALGPRDPGRVGSCLVGLAGYRALPDPDGFARRLAAALSLNCPVRLVPDTVPALASGGVTDGRGTVLIAGTGAICVRLDGTRTLTRAGGLGWLLGDEGSGFWLGREALRHAHAHPDPADALGGAVRAHCAADSPDELLRWAYDGPPQRLAGLAPLVSRLAADGDPAALAIARTAADHLADLVRATVAPTEPLVLTGAVATSPGPIRTHLLHLLADLTPRLPVTDAATAAARLAAGLAHRPL